MADEALEEVEATGCEAWGVLNPYGQFWTFRTWETPEEALDYVRRFFVGFKVSEIDRFRAIPVTVTVSAAPSARETEGGA